MRSAAAVCNLDQITNQTCSANPFYLYTSYWQQVCDYFLIWVRGIIMGGRLHLLMIRIGIKDMMIWKSMVFSHLNSRICNPFWVKFTHTYVYFCTLFIEEVAWHSQKPELHELYILCESVLFKQLLTWQKAALGCENWSSILVRWPFLQITSHQVKSHIFDTVWFCTRFFLF